jgi:phosphate transport system permease protein
LSATPLPSELPGSGIPRMPPAPHVRDDPNSWNWLDRLVVAGAWIVGIGLLLVTAGIVIYMLVRGIQYLHLDLLTTHPEPGLDQSQTGGFLDPLLGTLLLTAIGTLIAAPIGIAVAVWLSEYGKPAWLARAVESGIEIVAGTPSIVLALFGYIFFAQGIFAFLSFQEAGGGVFGRSFLIAGTMMSLIALPLVIGGTREALQSIPQHVREASYALGKDRIWTIRRVLLPASRSGIGTGVTLGMGRIIGDTAIVVILLGGALQIQGVGETWGLSTLKGTGGTLTSYVYNNSPAGEGNAPQKAYAAAFVLLMLVVLMNLVVELIARRKAPQWTR